MFWVPKGVFKEAKVHIIYVKNKWREHLRKVKSSYYRKNTILKRCIKKYKTSK